MIKLRRILKDYQDSGALHANIGVLEAIDENSFLTKAGHLFRMLRVDGVDDECLEPGQVDQIAQRVESAFRLLDENFRLYQYLLRRNSPPIPHHVYENPLVNKAIQNRTTFLQEKAAELYSVESPSGSS